MKFIDLLKLATRMFKARTSRTILTILGIGVGMATILFLVSLGFGIQRVVLGQITTIDSLSSIDIYSNSDGAKVNWDSVKQISYIEGVERTVPLFEYDGQVKLNNQSSPTTIMVTQEGYIGMDGKRLTVGADLNSYEKRGVILSSTFVKVLNKDPEDLIGETVSIVLQIPKEGGRFNEDDLGEGFKVVGVVEDEKANIYIDTANVDIGALVEMKFLKVKTEKPNQVNDVKTQIKTFGYKTSSVSEVVDQTKKFFSVASLALAVLGVIALLVSSIGMFNTMVITLLERTEEIGVMKAIGATDRNILNIFIVESALIGVLGGLTGIVLGLFTQVTFNFIINFIAVRMGGQAFSLFYSPVWFMILLVLVSLLIGVFTGLIPAQKASTIDPLEALKRK